MHRATCFAAAILTIASNAGFAADIRADLDRLADQLEPKVIEWRHDIHRNPELGNRELRTSGIVAEHLRALGFEVRTGVAHTGIVALLKGGKPG
ncbi:MAG: amidohydrolase, partial [Betaproteobacteria bacterium]